VRKRLMGGEVPGGRARPRYDVAERLRAAAGQQDREHTVPGGAPGVSGTGRHERGYDEPESASAGERANPGQGSGWSCRR
jgi:hypothetical protein